MNEHAGCHVDGEDACGAKPSSSVYQLSCIPNREKV